MLSIFDDCCRYIRPIRQLLPNIQKPCNKGGRTCIVTFGLPLGSDLITGGFILLDNRGDRP